MRYLNFIGGTLHMSQYLVSERLSDMVIEFYKSRDYSLIDNIEINKVFKTNSTKVNSDWIEEESEIYEFFSEESKGIFEKIKYYINNKKAEGK